MGEFADELIAHGMMYEDDRAGEGFDEVSYRIERDSYRYARTVACTLNDASLRAWFVQQGALQQAETALAEHYPSQGAYLSKAFHDIVRRSNPLSEKQRGVLIRAMALLMSIKFMDAVILSNQDEPRLNEREARKELEQ